MESIHCICTVSDRLFQVLAEESIFVFCDTRKQEIRVYGSKERRDRIMCNIGKLCQSALVENHAVPISGSEFEHILLNGRTVLDKIVRASGSSKVSLDVRNRSLLVEGTEINATRSREYVAKIVGKRTSTKTEQVDTECPICLCPIAESESIELPCRHIYCSDCFSTWLTGTNCQFPIACLEDSCRKLVPLASLKSGLGPENFHQLLRNSLNDHVRKNPSKLQFCFAPGCGGILSESLQQHQEGPNHLRQCSTCDQRICVNCQAEHEGMTCNEYALASLPPDRLRHKIIDEILTLRCPRCKQAFLDFDGCFALTCGSCPCRFCGWCLEDCGDHDAHP